jgi:hypothetical protein
LPRFANSRLFADAISTNRATFPQVKSPTPSPTDATHSPVLPAHPFTPSALYLFTCSPAHPLMPTSQPTAPQSAQLLIDLDAQQDAVLRELDELNASIEQAITAGQLSIRPSPPFASPGVATPGLAPQ